MTTRRQYNLPFCTLILDGLTESDRSPVMTTLMNAECHFMGSQEVLQGGKVFLESLVQAVSDHAQACLSGLPRALPGAMAESPLVSLEFLEPQQIHQLHFAGRPERQEPQVTLELTPVQFFDLLEAVDQLLGDPAVKLGLNLKLQPLERRYRRSEETVVQRAAGPALGLGSLALVGAIAWYVPIPSKPKVEPQPPETEQTQPPTETPETPPTTPPETKPTPPPDSPQSQTRSQPLAENLYRDLLAKSSVEDDPTAIGYMQQYLYRNLDRAWTGRSQFPGEAAYRVLVGRDGSLLGYRPLDGKAETVLRATPLEKLTYTAVDPLTPPQEAIAQFKVVFKPGILQVSPWDGYRGTPQWASQRVDAAQAQQQMTQLRERLASAWKGDPAIRDPLVFRVGLTETGEIGDYVASNAAGVIYDQKTPLGQWVKPEAAGIAIGKSVVPTVPLTYFRVTLNPDGSVHLNPW